MIVIRPKGQFVAIGSTSFVELLPSGDIIKTPMAGDGLDKDRRNEIDVEARIYQRLGEHPRLVKMKGWDPNSHIMVLEYMPNGTLEAYISSFHWHIKSVQRLRWISQTLESIQLLHSRGIIHCDIGPHNILLDAEMNLKITDFSGSSLDGSRAMICPKTRYTAPDPNWNPGQLPTVEEDIFSLGSTIYFIIMGSSPFNGLPDEVVERKFLDGQFPNLTGVPCADIIRMCWQRKATSVQRIQELVDEIDVQGLSW